MFVFLIRSSEGFHNNLPMIDLLPFPGVYVNGSSFIDQYFLAGGYPFSPSESLVVFFPGVLPGVLTNNLR